ncbi:MAG: TatD family hydrolase [Candidatus Gracilibacteria bacterium]|nr:TatD family hydrolase [Candidatus Gracilibacteria bacterium]
MIFDTHTHIFLGDLISKESEIIENMKKSGISKITSVGIDIESSLQSVELAKKYDFVYAVIGIHPDDVYLYEGKLEETINKLEEIYLSNKEKIVAIGECGFDFFRKKEEDLEHIKIEQEKFFRAQIALALKYDLTLVVHTRNAKEDTLRVLQETGCKKFILHCFSEDLDFAYKALYYSQECKISFSGIVTYPNALNVSRVASVIPLDKIIIETDCPYLAPQKKRGLTNEPAYVSYVLEKIYELREEKPEEIKSQIWKNSLEIFKIKE